MHFVIPRAYRRIMPPYVPAHSAMVYASGVAEIAGGAGLMLPRHRRFAGWWLIATLLAVFPANVHMALERRGVPQGPGRPARAVGAASVPGRVHRLGAVGHAPAGLIAPSRPSSGA